jgi:hypothetical protein
MLIDVKKLPFISGAEAILGEALRDLPIPALKGFLMEYRRSCVF